MASNFLGLPCGDIAALCLLTFPVLLSIVQTHRTILYQCFALTLTTDSQLPPRLTRYVILTIGRILKTCFMQTIRSFAKNAQDDTVLVVILTIGRILKGDYGKSLDPSATAPASLKAPTFGALPPASMQSSQTAFRMTPFCLSF